ncbi:uncharacterized protein LOC127247952 [Andrographis paniculata]|uniref:uncharacterized protein LOC127247952 n=1 Tax=Andrographis paniculata TaxID=175694 RepID=UPI0021E9585C|nr:uncharacterized protein LOC127247952 [Andrographis paniculata]
MSRAQISHRILTCDSREIHVSGDPAINLSDDTVFQFLSEEFEGTSPTSSVGDDEDEDEEIEEDNRRDEINRFWESQHHLLQSTIRRTTSLELRIRSITKEAVSEARSTGTVCSCGGRRFDGGCRKCLMEAVCRRLQNAGFDSAICKSKWKNSADIPSGEHTFVDVMDRSNPKKEVRVIIELNLRGEFEMARTHQEYDNLVKRLPEVFVGKMERLLELLKIVCGAAKKCMKEKKMHMAPWRKYRYMQAKWLRTCERLTAPPRRPLTAEKYAGRNPRPTASMLTVDLKNFSSLHRAAVAVV